MTCKRNNANIFLLSLLIACLWQPVYARDVEYMQGGIVVKFKDTVTGDPYCEQGMGMAFSRVGVRGIFQRYPGRSRIMVTFNRFVGLEEKR